MSKMFKSKQPVDGKKLQAKLFDTKKDCFSRLRYLRDLLATRELINEKQFFYNHHTVIFHIFLDAFIQLDASKPRNHGGGGLGGHQGHHHHGGSSKGGGFGSISELIGPDGMTSTQREELELVLLALERMLLLLPEVLEQGWEQNTLTMVFKKLVHYSNVLRVRTEGMRLFLIYYQIVCNRLEKQQLEVTYASLVPGLVCDLCPNLSPRNQHAVTSGPLTAAHICEPPDLSGGSLPPTYGPPVQPFPVEPLLPMMDNSSSAHIVSAPTSLSGGGSGSHPNHNSNSQQPAFEYKVEIQRYFLEHLLEFSLSESSRIVWTDYRDRRSLRSFDFLMATFCRIYLPYLFPKMAVLANPDALVSSPSPLARGSNINAAGNSGWPIWTVHPTISVYKPPTRVPSLRRYTDHLKQYFVYAPPAGTQLSSLVQLQTTVILWFTKYLMDRERTDQAGGGGRGDTLTQSSVHLGYEAEQQQQRTSHSYPTQQQHQQFPNNHPNNHSSSSSASDAFAREYIRYLLNSRRLYVDLILSLFHETLLLPFYVESAVPMDPMTASNSHSSASSSSASASASSAALNRTPMRNVIKVFRQWIHKETTSPLPVFLADPPTSAAASNNNSNSSSIQSGATSPPVHSIGRYSGAGADDSVAAGLQNLLNVFILSSANVFLLEIPGDQSSILELQVDVCKRVFNIYRFMVMKVDMERTVWENLVQVLIQVTRSIVSAEIPLKREDTLGGRLAPALFQTLIVTWIKANLNVPVSGQLWEQFGTLVSSLTRWEELINEWSATMCILNRVMSRYVFNINLSDLPLEKMVGNQDRKKRLLTAKAAAAVAAGAAGATSAVVPAASGGPRNGTSRTDGVGGGPPGQLQQKQPSELSSAYQASSAGPPPSAADRQQSISSTTSNRSSGAFTRQCSNETAINRQGSGGGGGHHHHHNHRVSSDNRRRQQQQSQHYLLAAWAPNGAVQRHRAFHESSSVLKVVAATAAANNNSRRLRLLSMSDSCLLMAVQTELCPLKRCTAAGPSSVGSVRGTPFGVRSKRSSTKSSSNTARGSPKISSASGRHPSRHMPMIDDDLSGTYCGGAEDEEAVESCTIVDADEAGGVAGHVSVGGGGVEYGDYSDASSTVDSTMDGWESSSNHHHPHSQDHHGQSLSFGGAITGKPRGLYRCYSAEDVHSLAVTGGAGCGFAAGAGGGQAMGVTGPSGRNWSLWSESLSIGGGQPTDGGSLKDQPLGFDMGTSGTSSTCSNSVAESMGVGGMNGGNSKQSPADSRPVLLGGSHKGWNAEISVVLWRRMLGVLGDLNDIPDPSMHKLAFECLVKITDDFIKMKDNISYLVNNGQLQQGVSGTGASSTTTTGEVQPSLHYFTAWLFRATTLSNEFKAGKLLAYKLLCIIALHKGEGEMAISQSDQASKNRDFLILFYLAIKRALSTYDMELTCIIIKYCGQKFFSSALYGSSCLLFDFISAANMIVSSQETKWPRAEALHLLGSLIGFFEVYGNVLILRNTTSAPSLETYKDLKEHVLEILIIASKREQTGLGRSIALCSLGIFLYKEFAGRSEHHRLKEIVNILIAGTRVSVKRPKLASSSSPPSAPSPNHLDNTSKFNNRVLCRVACDQLRLQTDHAAYLVERHPDMARRIIEGLCYTLSLHIEVVQQQNIFREFKNLLIAIQFTLAQWCMAVSKEYLTGTAISRDYPTFVDAENNAARVEENSGQPQPHRVTLLELVISVFSTIANINVADILGRRFTDRQMDGLNANYSFSDMDTIDYTIANSDGLDGGARGANDARSADAFTVKRAAQCILHHFLTFIGHFPVPRLRTTSLCALINEADDNPTAAVASAAVAASAADKLELESLNSPNVLMFVVNGSTLVSFVELADDALGDSAMLAKLMHNGNSTSSSTLQSSSPSGGQLNLIRQRPIRIIIRNLLGKFSWNAVALASPLMPAESIVASGKNSQQQQQQQAFSNRQRPEPVLRSIATAATTTTATSNGHYQQQLQGRSPGSTTTAGDHLHHPHYHHHHQPQQQHYLSSSSVHEDGSGGGGSVNSEQEDDDMNDHHNPRPKDSLEQVLGEIFQATPECHAEDAQQHQHQLSTGERGNFLAELNGTAEAADIVALFTNQHFQESRYTEEQRYHQRQPQQGSKNHQGSLANAASQQQQQQQSNNSSTSSSTSTSSSLFSDPSLAFIQCRQLAEQTGFLSWEKRSSIDLLASRSQTMLRELRHLDAQRCRETHKIAVIYVGAGQESREAILSNRAGSRHFEEFVSRLGWEVNLASHAGFMGGLEANLSTGLTAPYYADSFNEVIFHVSTRLEPVVVSSSSNGAEPSNGSPAAAANQDSGVSSGTSSSASNGQPNSNSSSSSSPEQRAQQLNKKMRHLGNDEVHIVWSEHYKEYRRTLLATEFCDALIVIYPLPGGSCSTGSVTSSSSSSSSTTSIAASISTATSYPNLYRIAVSRKPEVPFFGPLFNGVVVHRDELAALVRATAINASKAKRLYMSAYKHFFEERFDCISSLASRHRERSTFEEYATRIYAPRYDLLPTTAAGEHGSEHISSSMAMATTIEGFLAATSSLLERSPSNADSLSIASSTTTANNTGDHGGYTPTQPTTPQFAGHHQHHQQHQLTTRSPSASTSATGASRPTSRTSFK